MSLLPRYTRRTIHIAGTNGKGSTTAFVDSILREAGSFTGRFNSPHLLTIRDSILLDGHEISPDDYQETFRSVAAANEIGNCQCTNFELQTATALLAFERAHVAVAILEVGLGGRLDATNVIPDNVVVVSGISAIDLDHQAVLGNSLKQIAKEKAAIARKGRPCVLGHQSHLEVVDAIKRSVSTIGGYLLHASDQVQVFSYQPPSLSHLVLPPPSTKVTIQIRGEQINSTISLHGSHQVHNAELAVALVDTLREAPSFQDVTLKHIAQGLSLASWPGRLEWIKYCEPEYEEDLWLLVDGAHNAASAACLATYLTSFTGTRSFVISLSHSSSKLPRSTLEAILLPGDRVAIVPFSSVNGMPWVKPEESSIVMQAAKGLVGSSGEVMAWHELRAALGWARRGHSVVVVTGSLYLIADLYRLLPS